jgi:hypothetical protein
MDRFMGRRSVYLHELTDGFAAERGIGQWIRFYNTERPHSALDGATPAEAYSMSRARRAQACVKRPGDMMDKVDALPTSPQAQQPQEAFNVNGVLAA